MVNMNNNARQSNKSSLKNTERFSHTKSPPLTSNMNRKQKLFNQNNAKKALLEKRRKEEIEKRNQLCNILPEEFIRKIQMLFTDLNYLEDYKETGIQDMKDRQEKLNLAIQDYQDIKIKIEHNEKKLKERHQLERE